MCILVQHCIIKIFRYIKQNQKEKLFYKQMCKHSVNSWKYTENTSDHRTSVYFGNIPFQILFPFTVNNLQISDGVFFVCVWLWGPAVLYPILFLFKCSFYIQTQNQLRNINICSVKCFSTQRGGETNQIPQMTNMSTVLQSHCWL